MEEKLESLDLLAIWQIIRKRWLLIVVIPLLAAITSSIFSFLIIKPTYRATTTVIVGKRADSQAEKSLEYNSIMANQQLAKTYETIAKSRTVLERVAEQIGGNLTPEELGSQITVEAVKGTEVIAISVQDSNPEKASDIANKITTVFSARVIEVKKIDSVTVIDAAYPPKAPIKPKKLMNIAIAFVLGLFASIGLVFLIEMFDNTIKTPEEIESLIDLPVLGTIPQFNLTNNTAR